MNEALVLLCQGRVMHARLRPFVHRFVYRVFCLRLRVDQLQALQHLNSWLFGIERRRPVSFWARDHGARDGSDLMRWLRASLAQAGVALAPGVVWLQCFPRVFGYVFNPVSFWHVHDQQGVLRVILAEVNNTFGQRHQYVLTAPGLGPIGHDTTLTCAKVFHVSPFCEVSGGYVFRMDARASGERMAIDYFDPVDDPQPLIRTAIVVQSTPLTTASLLKALLSRPMMTVGVMLRIHWQAFKLWRQGASFHRLPALPADELTGNTTSASNIASGSLPGPASPHVTNFATHTPMQRSRHDPE